MVSLFPAIQKARHPAVDRDQSLCTRGSHDDYAYDDNVMETAAAPCHSAASCRYDASANTLAATGSHSAQTRDRFTTKPLDAEVTAAPLDYYGYSYDNPPKGRWPSRDPIGERGGVNLYGFIGNRPTDSIDRLGNEPCMRRGSPREKPELPKYSADCSCCDAEEIEKGRKSLEAQYNTMHGKFEDAERPHFGDGDDSCFSVNSEIALDLRVPKCWRCYLERRKRVSRYILGVKPVHKDHWVIICRSIEDRSGNCVETGEEASFDYWANRPAGQNPDLWFRETYPIYDDEDDLIDCRHRQCGGGRDVFF